MSNNSTKITNTKKILIVEDNPVHLQMIRHILEDLCELDYASNSEQAINQLMQTKYDLVILDSLIPTKSGDIASSKQSLRILETLQNYEKKELIVLCVSGQLTDDLEAQILKFGVVNRVFEKPFILAEFRAYISNKIGF